MPRTLSIVALLALLLATPATPSRADIPPRPPPAPPPAPPAPPSVPPVESPPPPVAPAPAVAASVPDPAGAGEARALTLDFEKSEAGTAVPAGFLPLDGRWKVGADASDARNSVLRQDLHVADYAVILATGAGRAFGDGKARVRLRPESGDEDASGGLVFRAKDALNYGLVRANAIEGNFRIYTVHNGFRRQIASLDIEAPELGKWHVIEVSFVGSTFVATLDGANRVEATNETLGVGWCGLWTKSDSVTSFDDLRVEPVEPKAAPADGPKKPDAKTPASPAK